MIAPVMPEKSRKPAVRSPAQRCSRPKIDLMAFAPLGLPQLSKSSQCVAAYSPSIGQLRDRLAAFGIEATGVAVAGRDIAGVGDVGDVQRQAVVVLGIGEQRIDRRRRRHLEGVGVVAEGRADIANAATDLDAGERATLY